jgi:hypothetical protein
MNDTICPTCGNDYYPFRFCPNDHRGMEDKGFTAEAAVARAIEPDFDTPPEAVIPDDVQPFLDWLQIGYSAGWIAPPTCETHHGSPMRPWEEAEFEDGGDPCILTARIWRDGFEHTDPSTPVEVG